MAEERDRSGDSELVDACAYRRGVVECLRCVASDDQELRARTSFEHLRRRLDELRLTLPRMEVGKDADHVHSGGQFELGDRAAGINLGNAGGHDAHSAAVAERSSHRLADADDEAAAPGDRVAERAVPAEVVLDPDDRDPSSGGGEHRHERGLHAVGMHDVRPHAA